MNALMKFWAEVVLGIALLLSQCHAEPRWCSVTGRGEGDTIVYPPIARAARVFGVVLGRLVYMPSGQFVRFEPASGPKMLETFLGNQLEQWSLKTNAVGDELCQTLVIADFRLDVPGTSEPSISIQSEPGGILRVVSQTQTICLCDPVATLGPKPSPIKRAFFATRHLAKRIFGRHPKPWD